MRQPGILWRRGDENVEQPKGAGFGHFRVAGIVIAAAGREAHVGALGSYVQPSRAGGVERAGGPNRATTNRVLRPPFMRSSISPGRGSDSILRSFHNRMQT
jgi:hypothetical protein